MLNQKLDFLVSEIFKHLETTDTLLYIYGPSNLGKTRGALVLARLFGPYDSITQMQLANDSLCFDDACYNGAICLFADEFGLYSDPKSLDEAKCNFKRILSGIAIRVRTAKTRKRVNNVIRTDLIIVTSNYCPDAVQIFSDPAIVRRVKYVLWNIKLETYDIEEQINLLRIKYKEQLLARKIKLNEHIINASLIYSLSFNCHF